MQKEELQASTNGNSRCHPPLLPTACAPFILEVIKDAVLLVDKERFLFANRSFEEMFDYAWVTIASNQATVILPEERSRFFNLITRLIDAEPGVWSITNLLNQSLKHVLRLRCIKFIEIYHRHF